MRVYPATIRSYCFLHSLKSFAKTNSVKNNTVSNAQTTHVAWETAPKVYCLRRNNTYVNATNHTFSLIHDEYLGQGYIKNKFSFGPLRKYLL